MSLASTMTLLATASGLTRKYDYPTQTVEVPCAVVGYPELDPNVIFTGGKTLNRYPVYALVGQTSERAARDLLSTTMHNVALGLNAATLGGGVDTVNVESIRIQDVTVGSTTYLAAVFSVEVMEQL